MLLRLKALQSLLAIHLLDVSVDQNLLKDCSSCFSTGFINFIELLFIYQLYKLVEYVQEALFCQ